MFLFLLSLTFVVDTTGAEWDSLQAAVDSACTLGGWDTVKLGDGTYHLYDIHGLNIQEGYLVIEGTGTGKCTLSVFNPSRTDSCDTLIYASLSTIYTSVIFKNIVLYHGVTILEQTTTTLDSCVICESPSSGIKASQGTIYINDTEVKNNRGLLGGGVYAYAVVVHLLRSRFVNNQATGYGDKGGGAVYAGGGNLYADACEFIGNSAGNWGDNVNGGAIYLVYQHDSRITNCLFEGNQAGRGGGIYIYVPTDTITVEKCEFRKNRCYYYGAALYNYGGFYDYVEWVFVDSCYIHHNYGYSGVGVMTTVAKGKTRIKNSTIYKNTTDGFIGALDVTDRSKVHVENCVVAGNIAEDHTGAFSTQGGGMWVTNSFVVDNGADSSGTGLGYAREYSGGNDYDTLFITSCNAYYNTYQQDVEYQTVTTYYQNLTGNYWGVTPDTSMFSGPVDFTPYETSVITSIPHEPDYISSLQAFLDSSCTIPATILDSTPETLYIRLTGDDVTPGIRDVALCIVRSPAVPRGIAFTLIEESPGTYLGRLMVTPDTGDVRCMDIRDMLTIVPGTVYISPNTDSTMQIALPVGWPVLALSTHHLDFGLVRYGNSDTLSLFIENTGSIDLSVDSAKFGLSEYSLASPLLPLTLSPGDSAELEVVLTPSTPTRSYTDTMYIFSNAGNKGVYLLGYSKEKTVWYVDTSGVEGETLKTIMGIIDTIPFADTIIFSDGTYHIPAPYLSLCDSAVLISEHGADACTLSGISEDFSDTAFHVIRTDESVHYFVLKGFTITGGNARDPSENDGGGIFVGGGGVIEDCRIVGNRAVNTGGGCRFGTGSTFSSDTIIFRNNEVAYNEVTGPDSYIGGGGIATIYIDNVRIENCHVHDNLSLGLGGGIHVIRGYAEIEGCTVEKNHAVFGGGIAVSRDAGWGYAKGALIDRCMIRDNEADSAGGGFYTHGVYDSLVLQNCVVINNIVLNQGVIGSSWGEVCGGGGFSLHEMYLMEIEKCLVANNVSMDRGGGFYLCFNSWYSSWTSMRHSFVVDNVSVDEFSGMGIVSESKYPIYFSVDSSNLYFNAYGSDVEFSNLISVNQDFTDNFWWFTDSSEIASLFFTLPGYSIDFTPFETSPVSGAPGEPVSVNNVWVMRDGVEIDSISHPDTLLIQVDGVDRNPDMIDACGVIVTSSVYPEGIFIALVETDTASGVYTGNLSVLESTGEDVRRMDDAFQTIRVNPSGDMVFVRSLVDSVEYVFGYRMLSGIERIPSAFVLFTPSPAIFSRDVKITFGIPERSPVRIRVFDIMGREVTVLADGEY
ncbi:hypothetical protein DRQ20_01875, partial [bacterium]